MMNPHFLATIGFLAVLPFSATWGAPPFPEFVDPNPNPGNQFGHSVVPLNTGNVVITSPFDDAGGTNAGAVYLFNGTTGALISSLRGTSAGDNIGSGGVTAFSNGNFLVRSPLWDNGSAVQAGAVTWGNGNTGISGVVGPDTSLVGSRSNDNVGATTSSLGEGYYIVPCRDWDNGSEVNAGAVAWGSASNGVKGVISSSNSLVGTSSFDQVGRSVNLLSDGSYLVTTRTWSNGEASEAGAVTWGSRTAGVKGVVSASNSLVGQQMGDSVGSGGIRALYNGNYLILSPSWGGLKGAVTWVNKGNGLTGVINSSNSLVGAIAGDQIGNDSAVPLKNGHYVVISPLYNQGTVSAQGAVTWGNGETGTTGEVTASNSLIGARAGDFVGSGGVTALANGHYVVSSPSWDNGLIINAGAVTWCDGTGPTSTAVSFTNSLVGSTTSENAGSDGVVVLANGNYLVRTPNWDNGSATSAGAITFGNGVGGTAGIISSANSLVGSSTNDDVGGWGVVALSNGNYVVQSPYWNSDSMLDVGAITWGNGSTGISGVVSSSNSLVGGTSGDRIGTDGVIALSNGNYVVRSADWNNGSAVDAGAVTWGSGIIGVSGIVSSSNSLVGSTAYDLVGDNFVTSGEPVAEVGNGNYVVASRCWDNGTVVNAGAVTWANGSTGITGEINSSNSLVGSLTEDLVGSSGIEVLPNGNYVVFSPLWTNGELNPAGAVTWGQGNTGVGGTLSADNSLIGGHNSDYVGSSGIQILANGHYLIKSRRWTGGTLYDRGAVTWCNSETGRTGVVSSANSLVGRSFEDFVGEGSNWAEADGVYFVHIPKWKNDNGESVGAVTLCDASTGRTGVVSVETSLVGGVGTTNLKPLVIATSLGLYIAPFIDEGSGRVRVGSLEDGLRPNVISSSTTVGSTAGGQTVTFTGRGFTGATAVHFGSTPATSVTVLNYHTLVATTPTHSPGTVNVSVVTPHGASVETLPFTFAPPEIQLIGNHLPIPNNDLTPEAADHTDFGVVLVEGGTLVRSFTIQNSGTFELNLTGTPRVVVGGSHSDDFVVSTQPSSPLAVGGNTSFQVSFDPSAEGLRSATLSIANDDSDENPYTFSIHGTGDVPPTLTNVSITSSNGAPNRAKIGDTVTVSFTASEPIQMPSVTLLGAAASVLHAGGNNWTASTPVTVPTPEGVAGFDIHLTDLTGNLQVVSSVTDSSQVVVDKSGPNAGAMLLLPSDLLPPNATISVSFTGWQDATPPLSFEVLIDDIPVSPLGASTSRHMTAPASFGQHILKGRMHDALGHVSETTKLFLVDTATAQQRYENEAVNAGLSGPDAAATAILHQGGLANLLRYAFNLDLTTADRRTLPPGSGTVGLPVITIPSPGIMRVEYLRRIGSGLIYTPLQRTTLDTGLWLPLTAPPILTPIDANWERIHHDEPYHPGTTPAIYGSVEVTLP